MSIYLSVCLSVRPSIDPSMALQSFIGHGRFFSFLILYTVCRTPWTGDQPVAGPLPTRRTTETQNKRKQTFMPRVVFETMIPVLERAKTVHALDRAATVIGLRFIYGGEITHETSHASA
jgi:hypothetical protein